jgi:hypothetical protein
MRGSRTKSNFFMADPALVEQAIAWRRDGKPYSWIAAQLNLSTSFIWKTLRQLDDRPDSAPCSKSICIPDSYHIAEQLAYDPQAVRSLVTRMGLMRPGRPYQAQLDHEWLACVDSETKAYFLGLIAADGWINRNSVFLALKESDSAILDEIRQRAVPFIPLQRYAPGRMNVEGQCRLAITSKQWINNLQALGITARKSLTMGDVTSNIPRDVQHHFVRGYFDGDGSICHQQYRNKHRVTMTFRGTVEFLQGLWSATGLPTGGIYPKTGNGIKSLAFCGRCRMEQLADFMYRDATLFLPRKKDRFVW